MKRAMVQSNPKLDKANKVIKTIYFTLYFLWNLFVIGILIYATLDTAADDAVWAMAIIFPILGIAYGSIGNAIISIIALIGLIAAACNAGNPERKKVVCSYVLLFFIPIITEALIIGGGITALTFL